MKIYIQGRWKDCIVSMAKDASDARINNFFLSTEYALVDKLKPYISVSNNRTEDIPQELRTISCLTPALYNFGGEYVKRYNEFKFNTNCLTTNINGIEYLEALPSIDTGDWRIDKNLPPITYFDEMEPIKYKVISILCKYDYKEKKYARGYEPEVIGEIIKNMFFIKYDPQLHPVVKRKHYKKE